VASKAAAAMCWVHVMTHNKNDLAGQRYWSPVRNGHIEFPLLRNGGVLNQSDIRTYLAPVLGDTKVSLSNICSRSPELSS
jgi:hypothetical protein